MKIKKIAASDAFMVFLREVMTMKQTMMIPKMMATMSRKGKTMMIQNLRMMIVPRKRMMLPKMRMMMPKKVYTQNSSEYHHHRVATLEIMILSSAMTLTFICNLFICNPHFFSFKLTVPKGQQSLIGGDGSRS